MQKLWQDGITVWKSSASLRWAALHVLAWNLGILAASLGVWILGVFGVFIAGAILGAVLGITQAYLLHLPKEEMQQWIIYTALGSFVASFPAYVLSLTAVFSWWIAALLVGLAFGIGIGAFQTFLLYQADEESLWQWLGYTMVAIVLTTWLTVACLILGIPLLLNPSAALLGRILFQSDLTKIEKP